MKPFVKTISHLCAVTTFCAAASGASAGLMTPTSSVVESWGEDITIFDRNKRNDNKWYKGKRDSRVDSFGKRTREDQEVEPGMARSQEWDAEGFFQQGNSLTFVAGFDLANGYDYYNHHYASGDLFIDTNLDAQFGDFHGAGGHNEVQDTFGYDYVFDIDWENLTYDVYALDDESVTITAFVSDNQGSNPWQYDATKSDDELVTSGSFSLDEYSKSELDDYFLGSQHHAASGFDLDFLGNTNFYAHWTMSCGNDNLMGYGTVDVPEPGNVALFSLGLIGLVYARRTMKKS